MPAIPIHGNYYGYYTKRPFVTDERLALLPLNLFQGARVLDVGCNEGWVTCEVAQARGACLVVGVDIDDTLIQAAWRRRRTVWSLQTPSRPLLNVDGRATPTDLAQDVVKPVKSYTRKRKRQDLEETEIQERGLPISSPGSLPARTYFPASCEHEFGSLPIPPSSNRGKKTFPHNISFRTADWTTTSIPEDAEGYDVVIAFSISKWIHLNSGDEGLKQFFHRVYSVLTSGGTFVLEPQSWDSYAKARRMDQKLRENFKTLKLRPTDFESMLRDIGFSPATHYGSIGEGGLILFCS
ncbi:Bin3-domain-containing protein [Phlegmacium glaucopus]|nr:Bin3-domain-containing protein [Phlegmacium glaucopus]